MVQQKTKIAISIPLSGEAVKQLPPKGNAKSTDKVFADLISLGRTNARLPKWAESGGETNILHSMYQDIPMQP